MSIIENAIEILGLTADGDSLTPTDLGLVQLAANSNLSEAGEVAFAALHRAVVDGTYAEAKRWFHDIEHLTMDHEGYVYWKGKHVEHFSYSDIDREAKGAKRLAEHCCALEANGIPVNARTATTPVCYEAPAGSPWIAALLRYYAFFKKNGQVMGIFYVLNAPSTDPQVVSLFKDGEGIHKLPNSGAYEAYHAAETDGWVSAGVPNEYTQVDQLLTAMGLTGEEIQKAITYA